MNEYNVGEFLFEAVSSMWFDPQSVVLAITLAVVPGSFAKSTGLDFCSRRAAGKPQQTPNKYADADYIQRFSIPFGPGSASQFPLVG